MTNSDPPPAAARLPMLNGYLVLDFSQYVAGPTCARLLSDFGADVIKIEPAPGGDRSRTLGLARGDSMSTYFFQHNHGKRSLALDLKHPRAQDMLRKLIARADVLIENYAPGVMARMGLDYAAVSAINPAIVMCSISMAGQSGPLADKPGFDYAGQAYAGMTDLIGEPDRPPALLMAAIGDVASGITAAMAIGFALLGRSRTGQGQYIDGSLLDTYFHMHDMAVPVLSLRPGRYRPRRNGALSISAAPYGIYQASAGYIMVAVVPHQWPAFARAIGKPELIDDERFSDQRARVRNHGELKEIIERWMAEQGSVDTALAALERERVVCAPVLTLQQALDHPHLRARKTVKRVHDPAMGDFDIPGLPVKVAGHEEPAAVAAPRLGEDNESVLRGLLGLDEEEIAELYAQGVLVKANPQP